MMKKRGICHLAVGGICILSVLLFSAMWFWTNQPSEEKAGQALGNEYANTDSSRPADVDTFPSEEALAAVSAVEQPFVYMIKSSDGVLVVYERDEATVFFETDIQLDELETDLQEKVKAGICFSNEQELYGFLESHSS